MLVAVHVTKHATIWWSFRPEVHSFFTNANAMSLATENACHHTPHFSSVVERNTLNLENCFLLTFSLHSRNALTAVTVSVLIFSLR